MRPIKKSSIRKLCVVVAFIFFTALNCFGRIMLNGSDEGYLGVGDSRESSIDQYVSEGAGYFLSGYGDIQKFLQLYELQDKNGVNYDEWAKVIDSAIGNIDKAVQTYELLIKKADSTPYKEDFIGRLLSFNYSEFAKKNGLNGIIFIECEAFLKRGDITGMFKHTHSEFLNILSLLSYIRQELSLNGLPELPTIWKLNETCAGLSQFGQYASRVFYAVFKNIKQLEEV